MCFCENPVAVQADIKIMFLQIAFNHIDQSALRFLWINDNEVQKYQIKRLFLGATYSPSCAIYVLNHCLEKNANKCPEALRAVKKLFCMDDYIQSIGTIAKDSNIVQQIFKKLQEVGFYLQILCPMNQSSRKNSNRKH